MINIMIVISVTVFILYGFHRMFLLYLWLKHRKKPPSAPRDLSEYPLVTVQLPVYNERNVVERLITSASKLDYPADRFEIQVLDDSTDDTREIISSIIKKTKQTGVNIHHVRRPGREGYKAGALAAGLTLARGSLVAIFDADFLPPREFLQRTVPYFSDNKTGMVQARWGFLNEKTSYLTEVEALSLRGHFRIEHLARSRSGRFFNFNGTAGIWRKDTILTSGGWQGDTLTEDLDLSYRAQLNGWRFVYIDDLECLSELPPTLKAFKSQQFRWMKGMAQVARKILPVILKSDQPVHIKCEAVAHLLAPLTYAFALATFLLLLPLMIMSGGAIPRWIGALYAFGLGWTTVIVALFHFAADSHKKSFRYFLDYLRRFLLLLIIGVGNSLNATRAAFEGFFNISSPFIRTPKYADTNPKKISSTYKLRLDPLIFMESVMAIYGLVLLVTAIIYCLPVIPWAVIFLSGWIVMISGQMNETIRRLA